MNLHIIAACLLVLVFLYLLWVIMYCSIWYKPKGKRTIITNTYFVNLYHKKMRNESNKFHHVLLKDNNTLVFCYDDINLEIDEKNNITSGAKAHQVKYDVSRIIDCDDDQLKFSMNTGEDHFCITMKEINNEN